MIPRAARKWLSAIGRKGGSVKFKAKAAAARKNGRKGGRPTQGEFGRARSYAARAGGTGILRFVPANSGRPFRDCPFC